MAEPLTLSLLVDVLSDLRVNFPGKRDAQDIHRQAEIYREGLTGVSAGALRHAAKRSIQDDTYFPKVARLRELAAGFDAFQRATRPPAEVTLDERHCPQCGEDYHAQRRYRPYFGKLADGSIDYKGGWLASDNGQWLLLEPFDRMGCRCTAMVRGQHIPHPDYEPLVEPIVAGAWLPVHTKRTDIVVRPRESDAA